jgi:hypothetical protein
MTIKMPSSVKPANTDKKAEAFIAGAGASPRALAPSEDEGRGKKVLNMKFDTALLKRIDAAAKKQGISRTAWLHVAASKALDE